MIRPLRLWHRRAFMFLAAALPAIFIAGLLVRPAASPRWNEPAEAAGALIYASASGWRQHRIFTRVLRDDSGRLRLQLQLPPELVAPDVLVYLAAAPAEGNLPPTARLLGTLREANLLPPDSPAQLDVVLYSLAHRQIIDSARIEVPR